MVEASCLLWLMEVTDTPLTRSGQLPASIQQVTDIIGGPGRNRTDVRGFAVPCMATLPPGRNKVPGARRPGPCREGAEISLRGLIGSRLGAAARRGVVVDIDLDEGDDRPVDQPLAGMLEIDRDSVADRRLHLAQPPSRKVGVADIHARDQPAAHGTPLLLRDW